MTEVPPSDQNSEVGVLASCVIDPNIVGKCMDRDFSCDTFYFPKHKLIFRAIESLWNEGGKIDEITLFQKLVESGVSEEVGGMHGINEITGAIDTTTNFDSWANSIEGHWARRKIVKLCQNGLDAIRAQELSVESVIETMDNNLINISKDRFKAEYFHDSTGATNEAVRSIEKRGSQSGKLGVPSGIIEIDYKLKGFKPSELTLVAARPSVGKTAFSLHVMQQAAIVNRVPTLYVSIEMSVSSLMTRMIQSLARVPIHLIDENLLNENQHKAMDDAELKLKAAPFWVDETPSPSVAQIRARARRLKVSQNLGMIIIDYLQLVRPRDMRVPREQQVAEISNSLKNLSKELDIPILLLCQLNRQSEINSRGPKLSDLRESGQLEQDCDVCLMLWKPDENEPNKVECSVMKNRNGPTGSALLNFQKDTQRFTPYVEEKDVVDLTTETKQPRFGK